MEVDDITRDYRLNSEVRLITPGIMVVGSRARDLRHINVNQTYYGNIREVKLSLGLML